MGAIFWWNFWVILGIIIIAGIITALIIWTRRRRKAPVQSNPIEVADNHQTP